MKGFVVTNVLRVGCFPQSKGLISSDGQKGVGGGYLIFQIAPKDCSSLELSVVIEGLRARGQKSRKKEGKKKLCTKPQLHRRKDKEKKEEEKRTKELCMKL